MKFPTNYTFSILGIQLILCLKFLTSLYAQQEYELNYDPTDYSGAASWFNNTSGWTGGSQAPNETLYDLDDEAPILDDDKATLVLDLTTAINMAIAANRNLATSIDNVHKAKLNVELVESNFDLKIIPSIDLGCIGGGDAGFGKTIGGSLELCKRFSTGTKISVRPYAAKTAHKSHTGVQAKIVQPLLRGFGKEYTLAPVYAAQFANRSAHRLAYTTGVDMIYGLVNAMYSVVRLEGLLKFDQEAVQRLRHLHSAIKMKVKIGMADSLDVYRTDTEIKQAEDNLENSKELLEDAKDRVREILALPLGKKISIDLAVEYAEFNPDVQQAIDAALINRMEIEQSSDRWNESIRLSKIANQNLWPNVDIVLDFSNIGRSEVFTNTFTDQRASTWGVGLMSATDWDRSAQKVAYQQTLFTVQNAERNFEQTQNSIILEVKRAIRSIRRASQKIALQLKQIHSSEGGLKLAKLKFDRALASNFDVIQAEKALRQAQSAHLSAIIEHKIGEYKFLATIGLLVDKPKICP